MVEVRHNCGLCLGYTLEDTLAFLSDLSHRGREVWGMAGFGSHGIDTIKIKGEVGRRLDLQALTEIFDKLNPEGLDNYDFFLGHNRYGTRGGEDLLREGHPHTIGGKEIRAGDDYVIITGAEMALVHNGQANNIPLTPEEHRKLRSSCDSEALLHFYRTRSEHQIMREIPAFGTVIIADSRRKELIAMRDPTGIKPGVMGSKRKKDVVASEDIALRKNRVHEGLEDLSPGTIYYLPKNGTSRTEKVFDPRPKHCMFEWNYVAHVDSIINGIPVRNVRKNLGVRQAKENFFDVKLVTFVPRCPEVEAQAYAGETELPFERTAHKPRKERAFQGPNEEERKNSIEDNLYLLPNVEHMLHGAEIIEHEDSLVRGNNIKRALQLLEGAGVRKVHVLSYTPPIGVLDENGVRTGCEWGVDMPPEDNFIALNKEGMRNRSPEEIAAELSKRAELSKMELEVHYLSVDGLMEAYERSGVYKPRETLCYRCIGGPRPDSNLVNLTVSA